MDEIKLDVQVRGEIGNRMIRQIRRQKFFPAIVYGGGSKPTPVKIEKRSYERIIRHHKGQSVVLHLQVYNGDKKLRDYSVIVKEEQYHPVTDEILHVDFKRISLTEKIEVKVPVVGKGEAKGVKQEGGSLDHRIWEIDIICLPTNIPQKIEIDVTSLAIGDTIHVKDIILPEGVITKHDPEAVLFTVVPPMKEEIVKETEGPKEPEVIKEKKKPEAPEAASEDKTKEKEKPKEKPKEKAKA